MEWLVGDLRLARRWVVSDSSITIPGSSHIENSKVVDVIEQAWGHYVLSLFKLLLRGSFNDSYTQWVLFSTCEMRADKAKKRKSRAWLILFICTTWQRFFHSLVQLVEFFIDLVLFTFWAETVQFHSCLGSELTLDPYSFLVLHRFSRPRVNWTRIHLLGKREWIRLRLRLRIGHRTDEVKYSKTEDSNPRK